MLRNRAILAVVGVLFILVVIYDLNFFLRKRSPVRPQGEAVTAALPETTGKSGTLRMASGFPVPRDREKWRRDPFRYKGGPAMTAGREIHKTTGIKLQGITVRDGRRSALVNGWVVETGDVFENVLITDITPYSIFVKDAAGVREIKMYTDIPDKEK
ncbi:MAG: hypothetical protein EPN25_03845 [Nitrospirae bacterium]|nr:MAG: hypothetical protein EPN25_03845 [Nitrospirota bacterium]